MPLRSRDGKREQKETPQSVSFFVVDGRLFSLFPEEEAEGTAELLREEMEQVMTLSVPLTVEAKYGQTWAEAH